jgi:hypothetical protein
VHGHGAYRDPDGPELGRESALGAKAEDRKVEPSPVGEPHVVDDHAFESPHVEVDDQMEYANTRVVTGGSTRKGVSHDEVQEILQWEWQALVRGLAVSTRAPPSMACGNVRG